MILTKNIKDYCTERKIEIKDVIRRDFSDFVKKPTLAVFQVGNVEASTRYIRNKKKDCEEVGIIGHRYWFNENITEDEILQVASIGAKHRAEVILQPKMVNNEPSVSGEFIYKILLRFLDKYKKVRVIPQTHKFIDLR